MTTVTAFDAHRYAETCDRYVFRYLLWNEAKSAGRQWADSRLEEVGVVLAELRELAQIKTPYGEILWSLGVFALASRRSHVLSNEVDELLHLRCLEDVEEGGRGKCEFCLRSESAKDALSAEARERTAGFLDREAEIDLIGEFLQGNLDPSARARIDNDGCGHGEFYHREEALLCPGFEEDTPYLTGMLAQARSRRQSMEDLRNLASQKTPECLREFLLDNLVRDDWKKDETAIEWLADFLGGLDLIKVAADLPDAGA